MLNPHFEYHDLCINRLVNIYKVGLVRKYISPNKNRIYIDICEKKKIFRVYIFLFLFIFYILNVKLYIYIM